MEVILKLTNLVKVNSVFIGDFFVLEKDPKTLYCRVGTNSIVLVSGEGPKEAHPDLGFWELFCRPIHHSKVRISVEE